MKCVAMFLLLSLSALPAMAAEPFRYELTPLFGGQVGGRFLDPGSGRERDLDETASFGLILNRQHERDSQWELFLSRQNTRVLPDTNATAAPAGFDLDVEYYHIGGNLAFDEHFGSPYIAATLGATRMRPEDSAFESETRFSVGIGGGLRFPINERAGIRFDVRALATVADNDTGFFCISEPDTSGCAVALDGRVFWQVAASVGVSLRF